MSLTAEQISQTTEQLANLYATLARLKGEVDAASYEILASGPIVQIKQLQDELVEGSTGQDAWLCGEPADLWLSVSMSDPDSHDAPVSLLTSVLDSFRKGVQGIGRFLGGGRVTGRPAVALKQAYDFRLVALAPGSVRLGLEIPPTDAETRVQEAIDNLISVVEWASSDESSSQLERRLGDRELRRVCLTAAKALVPRQNGMLESVAIFGRVVSSRRSVVLRRETGTRLDAAIQQIYEEETLSAEGDLRALDLDQMTFTLRHTSSGRAELKCRFGPELLSTVQDALSKKVTITGVRRVSTPSTVEVLSLAVLEETDQSEGNTLP